MTVQTIRDRFLARTERVRVRVPLDPDVVADHEAALAHRSSLLVAHEAAVKEWDETSHSVADTPPAEPDLTAVDAWIDRADRAVDEASIVVVMQWKPKVYAEWAKKMNSENLTVLEMEGGVAAAYYLRTEALVGDTWEDLALTWDDVADRVTEGEIHQIGSAAVSLATTSDAAPFKRRGKTSGPS